MSDVLLRVSFFFILLSVLYFFSPDFMALYLFPESIVITFPADVIYTSVFILKKKKKQTTRFYKIDIEFSHNAQILILILIFSFIFVS